jgi:hypothetical protein
MTLQSLLAQIMAGGAALGVLVYAIMEAVRWPDLLPTQAWLLGLNVGQVKRYLSIILAVGFAWLAFWAAVWMGYVPCPDSARQAVEVMFPLAASAVSLIVSQTIHGAARMDVTSAIRRSKL